MISAREITQSVSKLENIKLLRDIGASCGREALKIVHLMNVKGLRWTPGKRMGRIVEVQYFLPIKFILE